LQPELSTIHDIDNGALNLSVSNGQYTEAVAIHDDQAIILNSGRGNGAGSQPNTVECCVSSDYRKSVLSDISIARTTAHECPESSTLTDMAEKLERSHPELFGCADDFGLRSCVSDLNSSLSITGEGFPQRAGIVNWK